MRINVYDEELTSEVKLVEKTAETGIIYYGARVYLKSPDVLHTGPDDDDRTAITFWTHDEADALKATMRLYEAAVAITRVERSA
jgi:hypothetical protein